MLDSIKLSEDGPKSLWLFHEDNRSLVLCEKDEGALEQFGRPLLVIPQDATCHLAFALIDTFFRGRPDVVGDLQRLIAEYDVPHIKNA